MKYGAKMIAESTLMAVDNDFPARDYEVHFTIPEFTCLAPDSGFPDFATIDIRYVPDRKLVELKSLKLYIWSFRDEGHFFEDVTNLILNDLVAALDPRSITVTGEFNVRGGIASTVTATHVKP